MKGVGLNFGHYMQIAWLIVGATLQICIGGIKGLVLIVAGALLFYIYGMQYNKLWCKANTEVRE